MKKKAREKEELRGNKRKKKWKSLNKFSHYYNQILGRLKFYKDLTDLFVLG